MTIDKNDTEIDFEAFRRGDPKEFKKVLDRISPLVGDIAAFYTDNPEDQEDLYQEICVRIWEQRHHYHDRGVLKSWVFKLGHRHARNWRAKQGVTERDHRPVLGRARPPRAYGHPIE